MTDARGPTDAAAPTWIVTAADAGTRLDKFLAGTGRLGSRGRAAAALEHGKVYLNGAEAALGDAATRLAEGDEIRLWIDRPGSAKRRLRAGTFGGLSIVYEDDALVVVNKPPGVLAVPLDHRRDAASLADQLREHYRSRRHFRPFVVHRIDRDTSGLVVFAKDAASQRALKEQFRRREPERVYLAVVYGRPDPARGTWRNRLAWDDDELIQREARGRDPRAQEAVSYYRVVESFPAATLIEVRLKTGRQNQIRIQAHLHGHVLVGEKRYVGDTGAAATIAFGRQALHAHRLAFRHPSDGRLIECEAPPPTDFTNLLARLRRR